jgi:hypothetical protein
MKTDRHVRDCTGSRPLLACCSRIKTDDDSDCMYSPSGLINYPDHSPQYDSIFEAFAAVNNNTQSEDCLTLNIWTKAPLYRQPKAVLVHFYGGRTVSSETYLI